MMPDAGFALTDANAESSFWLLSRNRLFKWLVAGNLAGGRKHGCPVGQLDEIAGHKRAIVSRWLQSSSRIGSR
jgi:hypothetical protein